MLVLTMITGSGGCEAEVIWHRDKKILLRVKTNHNCIHLQLAGVQDNGIFHQSNLVNKREAIVSKAQTGPRLITDRKIDTFRMTACPTCDEQSYRDGIVRDTLCWKKRRTTAPWQVYCRINVMGDVTDTVPVPALDDNLPDDMNVAHPTTEKQPNKANNDNAVPHFVRLPKAKFEEMFSLQRQHTHSGKPVPMLVPLERTIALPHKYRHENIRHFELVRSALERKMIFRIHDDTGNPVLDQPLFLRTGDHLNGQFLLPGDSFLFHQLPVNHNKNSTTVILPEVPGLSIFVHAYKNDPRTFRKWYELADYLQGVDFACDQQFELFSKKYQEIGSLLVNGFAGSQTCSDSVSPAAATLLVNQPTHTAGCSQQCSNTENSLFNMVKERGRIVAVFICPASWGDNHLASLRVSGNMKKDQVIFLGYCRIDSCHESTLTKHEVMARFEQMTGYFQNEKLNMTHMYEKFYQYTFLPVFKAEHLRLMDRVRRGQQVMKDVVVMENDETKICVPEKRALLYCSQWVENTEVADINSSYLLRCIGDTYSDSEFANVLRSDNTTIRKYKGCFSVRDLAVVAMYVQSAAAMRALRMNVTSALPGQPGTISPLIGDYSDLLPNAMCLHPLPFANKDLDVACQFALSQMRFLCDSLDHVSREGEVEGKAINTVTEGRYDPEIVCQCLFLAILNRFTGNVPVLQRYKNRFIPKMNLPHLEDSVNFVAFVRTQKGNSFISQQHSGSIPNEFKRNKIAMCQFITNLAESDLGIKLLRQRIQACMKTQLNIPRRWLVDWLMECMIISGDFQGDCKGLGFLADKVAGDVEAFFPGRIKWSPNESVHLGWGSNEGLDCVNDDCLDNTAKGDKVEKLAQVHAALVKHYTDTKTSPHLITASGWELLNGRVVSCWKQREYSILDTEHLLCKLWVTVLRSNACRNISDQPNPSAGHCHPLPNSEMYDDKLKPMMKAILDAFIEETRTHPLERVYPQVLLFPNEK